MRRGNVRRASQEWQQRRPQANISMFNTAHSAALNHSMRWQPGTAQPSLRPGAPALTPAKALAQLSPPSLSPAAAPCREETPPMQEGRAAAAMPDTEKGAGHGIGIASAVPLPHVVHKKADNMSGFAIPARSFSSG